MLTNFIVLKTLFEREKVNNSLSFESFERGVTLIKEIII